MAKIEDGCGPESIYYCMKKDGRKKALSTLVKLCNVDKDNGTLTSRLVHAFVSCGYDVWTEQDMTWERVKDLLPTHHIIISWWTLFFPEGETKDWAGSHWSPITKLTETKVWLFDTDYDSIVAYPRATLDALWTTPEMVGSVLHNEVRLAVIAKKKPIKRRKKNG